jgi:hypothetical protein
MLSSNKDGQEKEELSYQKWQLQAVGLVVSSCWRDEVADHKSMKKQSRVTQLHNQLQVKLPPKVIEYL